MESSRTKTRIQPAGSMDSGARGRMNVPGAVGPSACLRCAFALGLLFVLGLGGCATKANHYNLAVAHHEKHRLPEAIQEYRQAIRENPADPKPQFNLAVIYQDQGRWDEAEKIYMELVRKHPDYAAAWVNLASIREQAGDREGAEKLYKRAVEATRDDAAPLSQYGFFLLRRDRPADAAECFWEALKREGSCANAYFGLGEIAEKSGDPAAAIRQYENAARRNPVDFEARLRAAQVATSLNDRSRAISHLQEAVALNPDRGDVFLLLGKLLREDGQMKEAEKAVEEASKHGAPEAECNRELTVIYERLAEEAGRGSGS